MNDHSTSNWAGPLAVGLACILIAASFYMRRAEMTDARTQPPKNPAISIPAVQVDTILEDAIASDPSLEAQREKLREEIYSDLINQELLVREALAKNMAIKDSIVRNRLIELMTITIQQKADSEITEQKLRDHYEENKNNYLMPAQCLVTNLVVPVTNKLNSEAALAELNQLFENTDKQKYSDDQIKGWFNLSDLRKKYGPSLAERVFSMEPGVWSEPFESSTGWHIIMVWEKKEQRARPFEQAKRELHRDLRKKLRAEVYEREIEILKKNYEIIADE